MAYKRHTWAYGEVITEDLMNNIEEGINEAKQTGDKSTIAIQTANTAAQGLTEHLRNGTNPHGTTKEDVGLGKVENVGANDMAPTYSDITELSTLKSGEKLSAALAKIKLAITKLIEHLTSQSNPHNVTLSNLGVKTEEWTFTLEDDSTVTKSVVVK